VTRSPADGGFSPAGESAGRVGSVGADSGRDSSARANLALSAASGSFKATRFLEAGEVFSPQTAQDTGPDRPIPSRVRIDQQPTSVDDE